MFINHILVVNGANFANIFQESDCLISSNIALVLLFIHGQDIRKLIAIIYCIGKL